VARLNFGVFFTAVSTEHGRWSIDRTTYTEIITSASRPTSTGWFSPVEIDSGSPPTIMIIIFGQEGSHPPCAADSSMNHELDLYAARGWP